MGNDIAIPPLLLQKKVASDIRIFRYEAFKPTLTDKFLMKIIHYENIFN